MLRLTAAHALTCRLRSMGASSPCSRAVLLLGTQRGGIVPSQESEKDLASQGEQNVTMAISNEMVAIYKQLFGRGPTKTRTYWGGTDIVVVTLEETLTHAERNLLKMGEHQKLRDVRMFFQYATVREFCEPVERLTGRKVRAFFSGLDTEADGMATETFVLHPAGYDGPSRTEAAEA